MTFEVDGIVFSSPADVENFLDSGTESGFHWLNLISRCERQARRAYEDGNSAQSLDWSQVTVAAYNLILKKTDDLFSRHSFDLASCRERVRAMSRYGIDERVEVLSATVLLEDLESMILEFDLPLVRKQLEDLRGLSLDRIGSLRSLKMSLELLSLAMVEIPQLDIPGSLKLYLTIRNSLP